MSTKVEELDTKMWFRKLVTIFKILDFIFNVFFLLVVTRNLLFPYLSTNISRESAAFLNIPAISMKYTANHSALNNPLIRSNIKNQGVNFFKKLQELNIRYLNIL